MSKRKYEIVPLGPAAKRRAAERAAASVEADQPELSGNTEELPAKAAPSPALVPVPGDTPAVGYVWVGRELVRIGRDDTKTFGERRSGRGERASSNPMEAELTT